MRPRLILAVWMIWMMMSLVWPGDALARQARNHRPSSSPAVGQPGNLATGQPGSPALGPPENAYQVEGRSELPDRPAAQSPSGSAGDPVPEYRLGPPASERSLAWDGLRMVLSLAAVLALLALGVKFFRRWLGAARQDGAAGELQILGRVALTPKEGVCLVRAGAEVLVVGVSAAGVTLLTRLEASSVETPGFASSRTVLRGVSENRSAYGSRLRNLVSRVRDVQAVWGIGGASPRDER